METSNREAGKINNVFSGTLSFGGSKWRYCCIGAGLGITIRHYIKCILFVLTIAVACSSCSGPQHITREYPSDRELQCSIHAHYAASKHRISDKVLERIKYNECLRNQM